jgi:hypothetical protein
MHKILSFLGVMALAGCAAPPPQTAPTPLHGDAAVTTEHSQALSIAGFSWRSDGPVARGTFTLTNNGSQPIDRALIVCDVYGARPKAVVGWLAANIQEPLPPGSTRTFTDVSMDGSTVAPEQTVDCRRLMSARES